MKYNAFRQRYHARGSGLVWNASIRRRKASVTPSPPEPPDTPEIEILTRDGSTILTRDGATVIARS
jgi:hypothetical protein